MPPKLAKEKKEEINKKNLISSIFKENFFIRPSFDIYGGKAGLVDLGPLMATYQNNILNAWREHFVNRDGVVELESTSITPEIVLINSGHVKKFADVLIQEVENGEIYRADHLLENFINQKIQSEKDKLDADTLVELERIKRDADALKPEEIDAIVEKFKVVSPNGKRLSQARNFNLMFKTSIGPTGLDSAYLRPEIAQGIFMNFQFCYEYLGQQLPFGVAQIGKAYRNEISPGGGLFRMREFSLAEIEFFYDEKQQTHSGVVVVDDVEIILYPKEEQMRSAEERIDSKDLLIKISIKQARSGIVPQIASSTTSETRILLQNEILAFYIGRTQLFLEKIGFRRSNLRFRQHLDKQRAHYARDCWDAEALTTSGWVEIIGIADRACFDLGAHAKGSGKQIGASRKLDQPIERLVLKPEKGKISQVFKKDTSIVANYIESLNQNEEEASSIKAQLNEGKDGVKEATIYPYKTSTGERDLVKSVKITPDMISLKTEKLTEENFYPFVIEPSFGISRILFSSIEQGIYTRPEDDQRAVIPFPPSIAPIKVGIFPLYSKKPFIDLSLQIAGLLQHFPTRIDKSSASIGRRYSRSDEIGIPFCITVDYASLDSDVEIKKEKNDEESGKESVSNQTVTIRERDSMDQIRVHRSVVVDVITRLVKQELLWSDAVKQFPGADKKDQKE